MTCLWACCWWKLVLVQNWAPPMNHLGPAEAATSYAMICSSEQVARGWSQAASDFNLHQCPSQEAPEWTHQVAGFRTDEESMTQLAPQEAQSKGNLSQCQTLLGKISLCGISPPQQLMHCWWGQSSQSACWRVNPHPQKGQQQSRLNHNKRAKTTHTGAIPGTPRSVY